MGGQKGVETQRLTRQEVQLRWALLGIAATSALFLGLYVLAALAEDAEFPFVANSVTKDLVFVLLALTAAGDVRRFGWLTSTLILAHLSLAVVLTISAISADPSVQHTLNLPDAPFFDDDRHPMVVNLVWMTADWVIAFVLFRLYTRAQRARYGLKFLGNGEFLALTALSEILNERHSDDERTPAQVAKFVDEYLDSFTAKGKGLLRWGLFALTWYPVLTRRPPLWMMEKDARLDWLRTRFVDEVSDRRFWRPLRDIRQGMIRAGQQLSYLGFYSDPDVAERCGYVIRTTGEPPGRRHARLRVLTPPEVDGDQIEADIVIIGSGAGGATLARKLIERGREVLIVERGKHVAPDEFSVDETRQFSALYADGALTLSTNSRFQVLQGMCVGGSTVVNNAVCFDMPDDVIDRWTSNGEAGLDCGLDPDAIRAAFAAVRTDLPIEKAPESAWTPGAVPYNRGLGKLLEKGVISEDEGWRWGVVECNIEGCIGCGLCNTGCAHGAKLSMLDEVLPQAQRMGLDLEMRTDRLRILSECRADRILVSSGRAYGVRCRLGDGSQLDVRARDVVVCAGALASSVLLRRSGLGGDVAGLGVAFNLGVPMVGEFDKPLDAYRGLNISHYVSPPEKAGYMLETWFQPIVSMSLFMPGWFDEHERNMRHYARMACIGAVRPSGCDGAVRPGRSRRVPRLKYVPTDYDVRRLKDGMKMAGRILLEGGAKRVMPPSFRFNEYRSAADLERLPADLRDNRDVPINTSHPQGGNRIGRTDVDSVVDAEFRVHGVPNVWVCDASVFPSAVGVNPQLTVMAMAYLAAPHIAT